MSETNRLRSAFVWGCFDLLHRSHGLFLEWAAAQATRLHIVVLPDEIVAFTKGQRPIQSEHVRLRNALASVRGVVTGSIDCIAYGLKTLARREIDGIVISEQEDERWITSAERLLGARLERRTLRTIEDCHTSEYVREYGADFLRLHFAEAGAFAIHALPEPRPTDT